MRPPAAALLLASFLATLAAAVYLVHRHWGAMDASTYPTGPELRKATDAAILRANDDPLLPEILEAASRAAADGKYACSLELITADGRDLPPERRTRIAAALQALRVRAQWRYGPDDRYSRIELSWE